MENVLVRMMACNGVLAEMIHAIRLSFHFFVASTLIIGCAGAQRPIPPPVTPAQRAPSRQASTGRARLVQYLDSIAASYTAARAAQVAAIHDRAQAEARQARVRKQILSLLGSLPERTPLNAKVFGETQADGFRIQKVLFESQPGFPVTALLYLPDGPATKLPAILLAPGHSPAGKAGDYSTAAVLARSSFVVLSYDPIGQGERLQYPDPAKPGSSLATRPTGEHGEASLQPMLIGDTLARYMLWDAMRGIDYLSQLPQVDAHRIGAFGCSGGGAMTALVGALDPRVAAVAVACYTTSFDTLLPSLGPQDGEQSNPRFLSAGLDFPDWIEVAAPRPYAVVATYSDMFPFAGARATVIEARRFYALFDPASAGTPPGSAPPSVPPIPSGPALNTDTTNNVAPIAALQFITGPGGHGALTPILADIVSFFERNLKPGADADHPEIQTGIHSAASLPKDALKVTPTGQVATSYPKAETVFTLNRKRAARVLPSPSPAPPAQELGAAIRQTTGSETLPGAFNPTSEMLSAKSGSFVLPSDAGGDLQGDLFVPSSPGRHPAVLLLVPGSIKENNPIALANKARFDALGAAGNLVLAMTPSPSPPGTDDMKSPLLGPFYLLSLRADLVGRTLVGLRIDDVLRATDYLSARPDVDPQQISAVASGHMGLVLLHAAALDPRLRHLSVDHVLRSYRSLLEAPLPTGAPEDIVPGVLLHYDIPNLIQSLGPRLCERNALDGSEDLSQSSTPLRTLTPIAPQ
jgi:cephalosporin-C deacetylase-like acetyl esterase